VRGGQAETVPLIGIVDDDPAVGESINSLVRSAGLRAVVFPSGEALLSSDHLNEAECLIVDVRTPRMSGLELQERLAELAIPMPIIFATAHVNNDVQKERLAEAPRPFCKNHSGMLHSLVPCGRPWSNERPDRRR
jgi:FixJ family two-component response regulator